MPGGHCPVGGAEAVHDRRDQQGTDDQRVDEDREREPESEFLENPVAAEQEGSEDEDHDECGAGDDLAALGLAGGDRLMVVPGREDSGGEGMAAGGVQALPFLLDARDEVDLPRSRSRVRTGPRTSAPG